MQHAVKQVATFGSLQPSSTASAAGSPAAHKVATLGERGGDQARKNDLLSSRTSSEGVRGCLNLDPRGPKGGSGCAVSHDPRCNLHQARASPLHCAARPPALSLGCWRARPAPPKTQRRQTIRSLQPPAPGQTCSTVKRTLCNPRPPEVVRPEARLQEFREVRQKIRPRETMPEPELPRPGGERRMGGSPRARQKGFLPLWACAPGVWGASYNRALSPGPLQPVAPRCQQAASLKAGCVAGVTQQRERSTEGGCA